MSRGCHKISQLDDERFRHKKAVESLNKLFKFSTTDIHRDKPIRINWTILQQTKRRGSAIEIIVHHPETPEKEAFFDARVAKFHAEYVAQYIEKLNCPTAQKLKLVDAIAQTILEGCVEEKRK